MWWLPSVLLCISPALAGEGDGDLLEPVDWEASAIQRAWEHLGADRPTALQLEPRVFRFAGGQRTRMRYTLHGLPVVGHSLVIASPRQGALRVLGEAPRWPTGSPRPVVSDDEALRIAAEVAASPPWHAELAWRDHEGELTLAWRVPIQRSVGEGPSPHDVWVDARDGTRMAVVPTGHFADALLYPQNPVTSQVERWTLPVPELASEYAEAASCRATDPEPSVLELAACEVIEKQAAPDANGDFLFVPRPEALRDPFAEVGAFAHVDLMSTWLDRRWDFRVAWAPIDVFVNFPLANAFFGDFDGDGDPDVSFGHALGADLAYDADVVYHELGHAVVRTLAPDLPSLQADELGLDWVSGSVNEGAADVFAMLLTGDPQVGEYAGLAFGRATAIRDLARPRTCPRDLQGEVHADGEIFGAVFWQMMQDERIGPDVAGELLMGSIALWDANPSWPKVANSLLFTADDLLLSDAIDDTTHGAIGTHLTLSGMIDCERIVDLGPGGHKELRLFNAGLEGELERFVGNVQLRLDPVDAPITLRLDKTGTDRIGWSAFVRYGEPVEHRAIDVSGLGLMAAVPEVYDELIDGTSSGDVVTFDPGTGPVYVMMATRNLDLELFELAYVGFDVEVVSDRRREPSRAVEAKPLQQESGCTTAPARVGGWGLARRR